MTDTCICHLKHAAMLDEHSKEISEVKVDVKVLENELVGRLKDRVSRSDVADIKSDIKDIGVDLKSKTSMRIFIVCVLIFVGMSGVIYTQVHSIDKQVTQVLTRQEAIRATVADSNAALQRTMDAMQGQIKELHTENSKRKDPGL